VITYSKAHEAEAVEKIANLAAFFRHRYGAESLERFSPEACEQADMTKWDAENDRPITVDEQALEEVMGEDIDWIENLDDVTFGNKMDIEVVIERPTNPIRAPPRPENADADTVGTFFPGQGISHAVEDESLGASDALTADSTSVIQPDIELANDESREARPTSEASFAEDSTGSSAVGL
jgi:hypothetical protein